MLTINVELRRPDHRYPIHFASGLCADWRGEVAKRFPNASYLVMFDANLARDAGVPSYGCVEGAWRYLWVKPGEENKNPGQYAALCEDALHMAVDRNTVVVAVGGGVTGDIAGFVAATLLRGLRLVQIPTTLLAQVDSSVGGKNGVNAEAGKNMIGTIHQPDLVLIDPAFLDTLPRREYTAGLAEIVKTAVLDGPAFFAALEQGADRLVAGDHELLSEIIARCCRVKSDYVMSDERDTGRRQLLNLGHTFGHVLESLAGYDGRVVHGEAVAVGLLLACRFSAARSGMSEAEAERVKELLVRLRLPTAISQLGQSGAAPVDWRKALAAPDTVAILAADKKAEAAGVNLALPRAIGDCRMEKGFPAAEVLEFMRARMDD